MAGFSTRALEGNVERLAALLSVSPDNILILKQIHSGVVCDVTATTVKSVQGKPQSVAGDAWITALPEVVLGIRTADCVPILLYDPIQQVVAAIHAGWRGVVAGVIENTIAQMTSQYGTNSSDILAAIGPAICQSCFEIGPEVAEVFQTKWGTQAPLRPGKGDRAHLDLPKMSHLVLTQAGLLADHIELMPLCTSCRPDLFYSYRRNPGESGRMIAVIGFSSSLSKIGQ